MNGVGRLCVVPRSGNVVSARPLRTSSSSWTNCANDLPDTCSTIFASNEYPVSQYCEDRPGRLGRQLVRRDDADHFVEGERVVPIRVHRPDDITLSGVRRRGAGRDVGVGHVEHAGAMLEQLADRDLALVGNGKTRRRRQIGLAAPARHRGRDHVVDVQLPPLVEQHDRGGSEGLGGARGAEVRRRRRPRDRAREVLARRRDQRWLSGRRTSPRHTARSTGCRARCRSRLRAAANCRRNPPAMRPSRRGPASAAGARVGSRGDVGCCHASVSSMIVGWSVASAAGDGHARSTLYITTTGAGTRMLPFKRVRTS